MPQTAQLPAFRRPPRLPLRVAGHPFLVHPRRRPRRAHRHRNVRGYHCCLLSLSLYISRHLCCWLLYLFLNDTQSHSGSFALSCASLTLLAFLPSTPSFLPFPSFLTFPLGSSHRGCRLWLFFRLTCCLLLSYVTKRITSTRAQPYELFFFATL